MVDLEAYREQSLETWGEAAPGWEDRREWLLDNTGTVSAWVVEKADPQPGQTILDALLAAGVPVEYDCRHGTCGRCTQRVLAGEPDHRDAQYGGMPAQNEWIRICVSRARSATLVLDL